MRLFLEDLFWAGQAPVRILFMLFERGGFDPEFAPFVEFATSLLKVLPDSRIVEEHHEFLRDQARASKDNVSSRVSRMQTARSFATPQVGMAALRKVARIELHTEFR